MTLVRSDNYMVIQGWMVGELGLKGNELLVYALIYGFSQASGQAFTGTVQYLSDWCNASKRSVLGCLKALVERGLLRKEETQGAFLKACRYWAVRPEPPGEISSPPGENISPPGENSSPEKGAEEGPSGCKNFTPPGAKFAPNTIGNILGYTNTPPTPPAGGGCAEKTEGRDAKKPEGFDRFWEAYPRKANKPAALKAFKRLRVGEALLSKILCALETYKGSEDWKRDGGQYIPYPSSWLNGERWKDVEPAPTDAPSAPPLPSVTKPRSKREQREELASRAAREEGISFREAQIRYGLLHPSFRPPTPQEILDGHAQDVLQEGKRLNQLWEEQYLAEHPEWREDHE